MTKNRLKYRHERRVVDSRAQGEVQRVALTLAVADVLGVSRVGQNYGDVAGAGEKIAEFVERDGHHAVGGVEGFFYAVAVVDVDVDVQHARVFSGEETLG